MADKNGMELFSTLDGGRDTIQMLQRMERLKKLMGTGEALKYMQIMQMAGVRLNTTVQPVTVKQNF